MIFSLILLLIECGDFVLKIWSCRHELRNLDPFLMLDEFSGTALSNVAWILQKYCSTCVGFSKKPKMHSFWRIWDTHEIFLKSPSNLSFEHLTGICCSFLLSYFLSQEELIKYCFIVSVSAPAGFPDHPHRGFETVTYMLQVKTVSCTLQSYIIIVRERADEGWKMKGLFLFPLRLCVCHDQTPVRCSLTSQ